MIMNKSHAIVWIRQDFRISKNHALSYATNNHDLVSAIYIYNSDDFKDKREAQRWWIYESLKNFKKDLKEYNIDVEVEILSNYQSFFDKYTKNKNLSFYWNKIYEPKYLNFDKKITKFLSEKNINFKIFKGNTLNENNEIKKNDGTPFKVFTPFWKNAESFYIEKGFANNSSIKKKDKIIKISNSSKNIDEILPNENWYKKFEKYWIPSEKQALKTCKEFIEEKIDKYDTQRDIPGVEGTSKISPYLANGQLNVETVWEMCSQITNKKRGYRKYINELGWREFSHSLINYFPEMLKGNLRKEFDNFPWIKNKKYLELWKEGKTGYPIVDAGMRELYKTGWMHNRLRMITGSFLVKHLKIHWMEGEKHFRNCLLDFNEANNVAGWQWVSGCGADAAPYFRIFNPILQGEKFDTEGLYVKKWVPELKNVHKEFIHKPWEMEENHQKEFKIILGKDYPKPIVDHTEARNSALNAFQKIKKN